MKSFVSRRNAEAIRRRFQPWNGLHLSLVSPMRTKGFCAQSAVHQYDESGRKLKSFSREQEMKDIRTLLQYCIDNKALPGAKRMYIRMIEKGFEPGVFQGNGILNTHVKAGLLKDARQLFDRMPKRDEVSWTIMIAGYANGMNEHEALQLFLQMLKTDVKPDSFVFASVLKACAGLGEGGEQVHAHVIRVGYESNTFVGNAIVDMHIKCGRMKDARQMFDRMSERNDFTWTTIITGYVQRGNGREALKMFSLMNWTDTKPNPFIISSLLRACTDMSDFEQGECLHASAIKMGFEANVFVGNSLATMYPKIGRIKDAKKLFDEMWERDVVSWTTMIVGFAQSGHVEEALQLFGQMLKTDIKPNEFTFAIVVSTCGSLAALEQGKQFHAHVIRNGLVSFLSVGNALTAMYTKCGRINDAHQVVDEMTIKDVVSWTTIIMGYVDKGYDEEALKLAFQIQRLGIKLNEFTLSTVLTACANLAVLQTGRQVHTLIIKAGYELEISVNSALISMYSKCGNIDYAGQMFSLMSKGDVVTWTTMITGYAIHGLGIKALQLFEQMQQKGVKPDSITFIGVLSACSNAGLVDEGWYHFNSISKEYGIKPIIEHYGCMVDLLGRAGQLDEAEEFIKKIPFKHDTVVWGALLGACKVHGKYDLGKRVADRILQLDPQCAGTLILLANMFAADGRWSDVANVRKNMKENGLKKQPGQSWIEVQNRLFTFVSKDSMMDYIQNHGKSTPC
ncbi:putative pentatricopeptide repeat-containing protein At3g47840 [Cryptomeria japonica]|uniref:putative pentatricopeptide repeat-containing protein At3g47840 n=1 Tax=Cryptomeria japonica TaxID=3369 RepID=UPI0027DA45BA|nr:putative pentatricopeptide repeat-containing protein At3g47840 [Cryptomeria japonica]XP_057868159.2 putative pentatricopeptide repeat-containing protein At3g47840 [Cryptomeria japonica]XP_057868161.2 putative pentatricopeptide repeat-containing protein At3g47840 [Cryptomeria japonica]XP_057868164.2 putative pentatricopeptide repeat-containing protein At3g47840 [Cryptomeria japonica]XP_059072608.1 putative pentatricopeptide repeat-containing protein At3g47840 [Cryptomeria japonica]XP_0590726